MKVLNLISDTDHPARSIQFVHQQIAREMRAKGVELITLYVCGAALRSGSTAADYLGCRFSDLRRPTRRPVRYFLLLRKLKRYLVDGGYDVVIADGMFLLNALLQMEPQLPRPVHFISVLHGEVRLARRKLPALWRAQKTGISKRWQFVAVSEASAKYIEKNYSALSGRVSAIENCVDVDGLQADLVPREDCLAQFGIDRGCLVYGAIGRLAKEKDYATLIRAFSLLRPRNEILLLIGDGAERANLEQLVVSLGIENNVRFAGYIERASRYLLAFDVFVVSSLSEGSPLALIEAMAAGRVVVCSDIPALRDISPYQSLVFPRGDAEALVECLRAPVIANAEERREVGQKLAHIARQRYSTTAFGEKYHRLLVGQLQASVHR